MKRAGQKKVLSFVLVFVMLTSLCGFYVQAEGSVGDQSELIAETASPDTGQPSVVPSSEPSEEPDTGPLLDPGTDASKVPDTEEFTEPDTELPSVPVAEQAVEMSDPAFSDEACVERATVTGSKYGYTGNIHHVDIEIANATVELTQNIVDQVGDPISTTTKTVIGTVSGVTSATLDLISGSDILVDHFVYAGSYGEYQGSDGNRTAFNAALSNLAGVSAIVNISYTDGTEPKTLENVLVTFSDVQIKDAIEACPGTFVGGNKGLDLSIVTGETITGTQNVPCKLKITKSFPGLTSAQAASLTGFAVTAVKTDASETHTLTLAQAAFDSDSGIYTWGLADIKNGTYTVSESGYTVADFNTSAKYSYSDPLSSSNNRTGDGFTVSNVSVSNGAAIAQVDLTNTYTPTKGTLTVTKTFVGSDGKLPDCFSIKVTDSEGVPHALSLSNADTGTSYTWTLRLPLGAYSVKETCGAIPDCVFDAAHSTVSASGTLTASGAAAALTNTFIRKTVTVCGTKNWLFPMGAKLPASVTVELLKNGSSFSPARTVTVTASDKWKYVFNDVPECENGCKIKYSVRETAITYSVEEASVSGTEFKDGRFMVYGPATAANGDREVKCCWTPSYCGLDITNTYIPSLDLGTGCFCVQKYKAGTENEPLSGVRFTLTKADDKCFCVSQLTPENGRLSFSLLPVGTYTLTETPLSGYASAGPWEIEVTEAGKVLVDVLAPAHGSIFTNIWNWLVNATGNEGFSSGTLTVYNELVPSYTVNYDGNSGGLATGVPASQSKNGGQELTISSAPSCTGHEFIEWSTAPDGSGKAYKPGDSYSKDENLKLYAQWKDLISFYINIKGDILDTAENVSGHSADLFSDAVYSDTAKFTGSSAEDTYYALGDTNVRAEFGTGGKLLLTGSFPSDDAVFAKLKALYPSGSTSSKMPLKTYGKTDIIWANLDTSHYSVQWYVVKDQADLWHVDGVIAERSAPVIVTHTVSYTWSGSSPSDAVLPASATYKASDPVAIAINPTTSISYWTFNGWTIGGSPAANFTMGEADVIVVGSWSSGYYYPPPPPPPGNSYTIRYDPGEHGAFISQIYNRSYGSDTPSFDGTPKGADGWTFIGWSPVVDSTIKGDKTYVAQWSSGTSPTNIPDSPAPLVPSPVPVTPISENPVPGAIAPVTAPAVTPQTGDSSNILLLALLAVLSAAGLGTVGIVTRKKKHNK